MTLKELTNGLVEFLKAHPEFADYEATHASECGYADAGFESPLEIAVPVLDKAYESGKKWLRIVSDDDGYRTNLAIIDWKFYRRS